MIQDTNVERLIKKSIEPLNKQISVLQIELESVKKQLALYGVMVNGPKFKVGQNVKRKSNYFNDFINITISEINDLYDRYEYKSSNGVWYSEIELLAY